VESHSRPTILVQ